MKPSRAHLFVRSAIDAWPRSGFLWNRVRRVFLVTLDPAVRTEILKVGPVLMAKTKAHGVYATPMGMKVNPLPVGDPQVRLQLRSP